VDDCFDVEVYVESEFDEVCAMMLKKRLRCSECLNADRTGGLMVFRVLLAFYPDSGNNVIVIEKAESMKAREIF